MSLMPYRKRQVCEHRQLGLCSRQLVAHPRARAKAQEDVDDRANATTDTDRSAVSFWPRQACFFATHGAKEYCTTSSIVDVR